MAIWSRVFNRYCARTSTSGTCPTSCYNITSPDQGAPRPSIHDELPVSVSSTADAVGYWVDQLSRRLAATPTLVANSDVQYTIDLRRGQRLDVVVWRMQDNKGTYPLFLSYSTGNDSGDANFQNVNHAIDWLVQQLA